MALELIECIGLPDNSIFSLQASPHHQNVPLYPITRQLEQRIGIRSDDTIEANIARLQNFLAEMPSYESNSGILRHVAPFRSVARRMAS